MLTNLTSRHLVALFSILIFSILLRSRKSFRDANTKYFWLTIISCLLLVFEDVLETAAALDPSLRFWRLLLSVCGYTFRSTAALGLLLVVAPKEKRGFVLWIPALVTLAVCSTSFFSDIAFGFDADYKFYRGPLGYVAFLVPILYLCLILWIVFKRYTERNGAGRYILPICGIFCLAATFLDIYYGGVRLNEALVFSSVFFYITLYSHDSRKDPLTGLLNRQAFYDDCKRLDRSVKAVASLDMNGLKRLNDSRGHSAGDVALIAIGRCISEAADRDTLAYRIGGDEFVVLFFHHDEQRIVRTEERIRESVSRSGYSISIGYALRDSGSTLEDAIRVSDGRMFEDKSNYYRQNEHNRRRR
ncbi:MAG: diguanylate cyclase [Clostridia bacterium]|nr:diguanylate cyclase [Clostridia bacterium]